ncbi:MAG: protein kinase, partial [Eubacteriales bacterium]|nr:protein kinase [Eubacteriales bacterium]
MKLCLGCMEEIQDNVTICPYCGYKEDTPVDEAYYLSGGTLLAQRYIVGKVLGYGGFGITYIGWDVLLKRKVAIKEYFPSDFVTRGVESTKITIYSGDAYTQFQAGLTRFISEAKSLAQFNHTDGIVHIYDCIQENGTGYIIMEFLNGQTIKEILKFKNKYSYEEAEAVILHVLDALEEVHKTGIIHRDIAPDNLFITKDGEIKLIDFGAARYAASSKSKSLSVILKPGYAPEEQYRAHGEQGPWTDVYGVGATFYRMITGVRPEEAIERLIDGHIQSPSSLGIDIPLQKETALMKSLSVKKEGRFQTVAEFKEALLGTADENSSATGIEKPGPPAYPSGKWLVLGASVFLAVTVFAFLLGRNAPVQETSLPGNQDNKSVVESTPMLNIQEPSGSARIPVATPSETARTSEVFPTSDLVQIPETSPTPEPTPMPAISSAPEPTIIPEISLTPAPTPTPEASPAPEPTPTPEASSTPAPTTNPKEYPTPEPTTK